MIRVDVNLAFLLPGIVGGSEEFSVRLLKAVLDASPGDLELRVVAGSDVFDAHPVLAQAAAARSLRGPLDSRPYRILSESALLPRLTRGADLVHHFGGRLPARSRRPAIVTIHDIQPLDRALNFSPLKREFMRRVLPRTAKSADVVCTPTRWVADRVIERLGADPDRVRVLSPALGRRPIPSERDQHVGDLRSRRVILYPAVTHPHKNHGVLLEAMQDVARSHPEALLVLTGGIGAAHESVMTAMNRFDPRGNVVRHLGRIPELSLGGLMASAELVAFPSRYEGFGLPVLEAMQAGTPVIAADTTCLPEVVGGAGELVSPDDPEAWADAIRRLLDDEHRRTELAAAGAIRAAEFSADKSAAALMSVWRDAVA